MYFINFLGVAQANYWKAKHLTILKELQPSCICHRASQLELLTVSRNLLEIKSFSEIAWKVCVHQFQAISDRVVLSLKLGGFAFERFVVEFPSIQVLRIWRRSSKNIDASKTIYILQIENQSR